MARTIREKTGVKSLQPPVCQFRWIIQNYSFCFKNTNSALNSPCFKVAGISDKKWYLRLFPRQGDESSEFVGLYLEEEWAKTESSEKDKTDFKFDLKLSAIGPSGKLLSTREYRELEFKIQRKFPCAWGSSHFVKIKDIEKDAKDSSMDTLTVCCYMSRKNFDVSIPNGYLCRTAISVDRLTFKWNLIFNLNKLFMRQKLNFPGTANFEMVIYEPIVIYEPDKHLLIDIYYDKSKLKDCKGYIVNCKLTMQDGTSVICSEKAKHCFDHFPGTWTFPSSVFSTELQNFRRNYVKEKKFVLFCEITCSNNKESHFTSVSSITNDTNIQPTLEEGTPTLRKYFPSKKCSDIKLVVNNQVAEDHKTILPAQSPVFETKLEQNKLEAKTEIGNIFDVDTDTIKLFFDHLCADNVKKIEYEQAKVLVVAAEKFCKQSLSLKEKCLASLKSEICEENACEVLSLANAVGDIKLYSTAMKFLVDNSDKILSSPQWLLWMNNNMKLASFVMSRISANLCTLKTAGCASTSNSEYQQKKRKIN